MVLTIQRDDVVRGGLVSAFNPKQSKAKDSMWFRWSNKAGAAPSRALRAAEDEAEEQHREGGQ